MRVSIFIEEVKTIAVKQKSTSVVALLEGLESMDVRGLTDEGKNHIHKKLEELAESCEDARDKDLVFKVRNDLFNTLKKLQHEQ